MDEDAVVVRNAVQEATTELSKIKDGDRMVELFSDVKYYMTEGENSAPPHQKTEFIRVHYTPFLRFLVAKMGPQWMDLLTLNRLPLWESFFLEGPPDQAFLVLMDSFGRTGSSVRLDRCVFVLGRFLQRGLLADMIWVVCQQQLEAAPTPILHDAILGKICTLPDIMANCLQKQNKSLFYPKNYYPIVGNAILQVLRLVSDCLRDGKDCSISFVSRIVGKICMQGRHEELFSLLVPRLSALVKANCIWQRMCWRLMESVPDRWMEAVVTGLVQTARGPSVLSQLLGDLVLKNKTTQFLLTQKMLLLQYSLKKEMLQNILGYLSLDKSRRHLLVKIMLELMEVWSSSTMVKHAHHAQILHLCRAIFICLSLLNKKEIESCKDDVLFAITTGTRNYVDTTVPAIRHLGFVVAECVSRHMDPGGPQLALMYEEDEECKELKSLLTPPCLCPTDPSQSVTISVDSTPSKVDVPKSVTRTENVSKSDSELDSDDDLEPYDMSTDTELKKGKAPAYIRDCMEVLLSDDLDRLEVTMTSLAALIRANPAATKEVSVEFAKILLHLDDKPGVERFTELRYGALVALTVTDPVPVSEYLTGEFYSLNYNLRQRMDMLDVLATAAQKLSEISARVKTVKSSSLNKTSKAAVELSGSEKADAPIDWRKVVEERIKSKTRRFGKGSSSPAPVAAPNRFHPVAGHFFFPLIQTFDRPVVTFDLLGEDRLVLGRLVHTLGILMHLALHATVASQMGKALMEFIWVLRFHIDPFVRQGLLFCVSTILLSVPWERLITDSTDEVLEMSCWLADVAEKDPDDDCRRLALNGLVLIGKLRNNLKPPSGK
ncbi:telomere length regulation protein TEL2 homolog [Discoglossus pictus]